MSRAQRFGAGAVRVRPELGDLGVVERATALHAIASRVAAEAGATDYVVGGTTFLLVLGAGTSLDLSAIAALTDRVSARPAEADQDAPAPALHEISVVYDGADLDALAAASGLSIDHVIALHSGPTYTAILCGFLPGFAYLAEIDPRLRHPRRASPRHVVPAGSVGVAGAMTGVYPFASPGGWNLLGRAVEAELFDPTRAEPRRIAPLDRVRFVPTAAVAPRAPWRVEPASSDERPPALLVLSGGALASLQDRGRPGRLRDGVPRGGALDDETLVAANRAVGNDPSDACIELPRGGLRVRARGALRVSLDGDAPIRLADGDALEIAPRTDRGVRYVAVAGGIDVPVVLGARSTHLVAGFGGFGGRRLRPGDVLPIGPDPGGAGEAKPIAPPPDEGDLVLRVSFDARDPALAPDAQDALLSAERAISSSSDRVGTRLDGGPIPRGELDAALPEPVVPGAVQITSDGGVIVLGPDCATTGGYPILGVVDAPSLARLGRAQPGARVRFVER